MFVAKKKPLASLNKFSWIKPKPLSHGNSHAPHASQGNITEQLKNLQEKIKEISKKTQRKPKKGKKIWNLIKRKQTKEKAIIDVRQMYQIDLLKACLSV